MSDADFPSGAWTGFFMQPLAPGRHTMDMNLGFLNGHLDGRGRDWVGDFSINGEYDPTCGECRFTKHYHGKHDVNYIGRNEGQGIWGVWELSQLFGLVRGRGVFHIWPEGVSPTREADLTALAMSPGQLHVSPVLLGIGIVVVLVVSAAIGLFLDLDNDLWN